MPPTVDLICLVFVMFTFGYFDLFFLLIFMLLYINLKNCQHIINSNMCKVYKIGLPSIMNFLILPVVGGSLQSSGGCKLGSHTLHINGAPKLA